MLNALKGKKSYLVAAALIIYAAAAVYLGKMDYQTAITLVLNGLGLGALRNAIG